MVLLTVAAVLIFSLFIPVKTVLLLEGQGKKETIKEYEIEEGRTFSVSFVHSVNQSAVKETYQVRGTEIYLIGCTYSAFGAGVATELGEGETLSYTEEGEMVITGIDRKLSALSYIVGTVSDHVLEINKQEISMRETFGRNSTVRFKIEKRNIFLM